MHSLTAELRHVPLLSPTHTTAKKTNLGKVLRTTAPNHHCCARRKVDCVLAKRTELVQELGGRCVVSAWMSLKQQNSQELVCATGTARKIIVSCSNPNTLIVTLPWQAMNICSLTFSWAGFFSNPESLYGYIQCCLTAQISSRSPINKVAKTQQNTDKVSTGLFTRRKSHPFMPCFGFSLLDSL